MICVVLGHKKGRKFVYSGGGLVMELCKRCYKTLDVVAVEDFAFGDELLDFMAAT